MVALTGRQIVERAVCGWPGYRDAGARRRARRNGSLAGPSLSVRHAAAVWREEREQVARGAGKLFRGVGQGERERLGAGVAQLEFVSRLCEHMQGCAECWRGGTVLRGDRAGDWLLWGLGAVGELRPVMESALRDSGKRRGLTLPRAVELRGRTESA